MLFTIQHTALSSGITANLSNIVSRDITAKQKISATIRLHLLPHALQVMLLEYFIKRRDDIHQPLHWCQQKQRLSQFHTVPLTYLRLLVKRIPAGIICTQQYISVCMITKTTKKFWIFVDETKTKTNVKIRLKPKKNQRNFSLDETSNAMFGT